MIDLMPYAKAWSYWRNLDRPGRLRALVEGHGGEVRYTPSVLPEPESKVRPEQDPRLAIWQVRGDRDDASLPDPLVDRLIWPGGKFTLVSPPKAGKSYLAIAMSGAIRGGRPFLGLATEPGNILYLTEEPASTFDDKLERFGITPYDPGLRFIRRSQPEVSALSWPEVVERVVLAARTWGTDLVVVDVLHRWAGFGEEGENRSGVVGPAITALDPLTEEGVAILILHHAPWNERRARGSTDIHGASDNVLHLARDESTATLTDLGGRFPVLGDDERLSFRLAESGLLEPLGPQRLGAASRTTQVVEVIERAEEPVSTTDLAAELGWSEQVARRWAERAHRHGLLGRATGPHGEYQWRVRSWADLADELEGVTS